MTPSFSPMIVTCSASISKPPGKILRQHRPLGFFIEALTPNNEVMNPGNDCKRRSDKLNLSSCADRRQHCRNLRDSTGLAPESGRKRPITGNEADQDYGHYNSGIPAQDQKSKPPGQRTAKGKYQVGRAHQ